MAQALDEETRLESRFLNKTGGKERIATIRTEMQTTRGEECRNLSRRSVAGRRRRRS